MHLAQLQQPPSSRQQHHASRTSSSSAEPCSPLSPPPGSFSSAVTNARHLFQHRGSFVLFGIGILIGFLIAHDTASCPTCNCNRESSSSSSSQSSLTSTNAADKFDSLFPLFHPAPHGFVESHRLVSTQWTQVERRLLKQHDGSAADGKAPSLLSWDWVNLRSHINVLPVFTAPEAVAYLRVLLLANSKDSAAAGADGKQQKKTKNMKPPKPFPGGDLAAQTGNADSNPQDMDLGTLLEESKWLLSGSAHEVLSGLREKKGSDGEHQHDDQNQSPGKAPSTDQQQQQYLFPIFLQTKYGYSGISCAVVGGLYEPADGNLKRTAERELKEELGISCQDVTVLARTIVDGNRGTGHFQTHFARKCKPVEKTRDDRAAADLEKQRLIFVTREDLIKIMHRTQGYAEATLQPIPQLKAGEGPAFLGGKDNVGGGGGGNVVDVDDLVIKEAKWFATISSTLLALEHPAPPTGEH